MSELRKMRAAGYARVSTDTELQDGSYETQVQYFRDMIMEDPNLEFVDVYGDKGISGRDAERRPGFLQMIQDCKDGKIDVIYTKSVSRFARSLADLVEVVTDLRKIGVTIYFEEQGLNTMERQTDLYMNILGAIAEEESRSIGENVRMGLEARVLTGHPVGRVAYGYRRIDKDANWAICEDEANRIRLAFRMAASGECYQDIRKALDRMEEEAGTGITWNKERLRRTFNTDDPTSNFNLALLGAISQDESNSIGLNRRWAYQKRFEQGEYNIGNNRILGYDTVDGKLVPNQDAWIIREIFERYVAGESYSGISRALAQKGAKSLRGGKFTVEAIRYILSNETYVGDKHLMKQPPTDYLTHQPMKLGEYKDYYLTDDHEGIVSRELWDQAQGIKKGFKDNLKNGIMGAGEHHFLYGKVFCGECGAPFVRRTLKTKGGVYRKVWNCRERQKGQKGNGCRCRFINEEDLISEIVKTLGWEEMDEAKFAASVSRVLVSDNDVKIDF